MRRRVLWFLAVVAIAVVGVLAYLYLAGGSGEPSTDLTTPTIAGGDTTTTDAGGSSTSTAGEPSTRGGVTAFVIDPAGSTAAFEIDEVLRGSPNRVVGITSEVAGQFEIDLADVGGARFSQIVINARTFATDSANRDRAIRSPIVLDSGSDEFELITFDVTAVDGLGGAAAVGQELEFRVTGDLKIKDVANPVTFNVTATLTDESTITGSAVATVLRSDYGIGIPNAPGVAEVADEVLLRLDFVAGAS